MRTHTPPRSRLPLVLQTIAFVGILTTLALLPPERGRLLVIALPGDAAALLPRLIQVEARLVARGPLPGSYIVEGSVTRLRTAVGGAVILAAPQAGCGTMATIA